MNLVSFDLFDTLLVRRCGRPENIFALLARQQFHNNSAACQQFYAWRMAAESLAKQQLKKQHLTISDIYATCPIEHPNQLAQMEQRIESENLIAVPGIKKLIQTSRQQGNTICFISDMYLPSSLLREVLEREGCISEEEQVWVSCEHRARKSTGALYELVKQHYKPDHWTHYGDNINSDINEALRHGIQAIQVKHSYTPVESKLMQCAQPLATLAGLSRSTSLLHGDTEVVRFAADFVAPVYISYCQWGINDAIERGIKHLYFLNRDSYLFYKIAQTIDAPDITLHYLFLSRKSLKNPYEAVLGNNDSNEELKVFKEYIVQEGLSSEHCAIVDVGWWGTTRKMLNAILDFCQLPRAFFYYLDVRGNVISKEFGDYAVYFQKKEISTRLTFLLENYFSASPYPTTIGYRRNETSHSIEPILGNEKTEKPLVELHESVARSMYSQLLFLSLSASELKLWSRTLLQTLDRFDVPINVNCLEGKSIQRLSCRELIKYALGGYVYERSSVILTCGYRFGKILITGNWFTEGIKRFLYQIFLRVRKVE